MGSTSPSVTEPAAAGNFAQYAQLAEAIAIAEANQRQPGLYNLNIDNHRPGAYGGYYGLQNLNFWKIKAIKIAPDAYKLTDQEIKAFFFKDDGDNNLQNLSFWKVVKKTANKAIKVAPDAYKFTKKNIVPVAGDVWRQMDNQSFNQVAVPYGDMVERVAGIWALGLYD